MNPDQPSNFSIGIAPEHGLALLAGLLVAPALWLAMKWLRSSATHGDTRAITWLARYEATTVVDRFASALLLTTGVVHIALPFGAGGHHGGLMSFAFLATGVVYLVFARRVFTGSTWRRPAAWLLAANVVGYLVVAGSGWHEEADQVGIATTTIELIAFGLIVAPGRTGLGRFASSAAIAAFTLLTGLVIWVGTFAAHDRAHAANSTVHPEPFPRSGNVSKGHAPGTGEHSHPESAHPEPFARSANVSKGHGDFVARAQAGTIMRPRSAQAPTPEEAAAAARFAEATKAGVAKYADITAALADGYKPDGPALGIERHYKHHAYGKDGAILDPTRPELLVYAQDGDRAVLLGAVYTMDKAGTPGPEIGGPLTRWHAHNICVTLLPPAIGLVTPFGSCPVAAVAVTIPDMIHVWTVDNPGGPYAQHLDDKWVRALLASEAP
jgi:hypothetical protein